MKGYRLVRMKHSEARPEVQGMQRFGALMTGGKACKTVTKNLLQCSLLHVTRCRPFTKGRMSSISYLHSNTQSHDQIKIGTLLPVSLERRHQVMQTFHTFYESRLPATHSLQWILMPHAVQGINRSKLQCLPHPFEYPTLMAPNGVCH